MNRGRSHGFLVGCALLLATRTEAACHKFSVWNYPWPQRCGVQRHVSGLVTQASLEVPLPAPRPDDADMPLPDLAGIWDAPADAETRARILAIVKLREQLGK
jgi:hypothetical protein